MRSDSIAWERAAEVRDAADGWRRAGAIDARTHQAIRNAYPDPCITPSAVWRVLTAVMVTAIVLCAFGAFVMAVEPRDRGLALLLWLFAAACFVATEYMEASPRLARRGAAGAASFWGIVLFLGGLGLLLHVLRMRTDPALHVFLLASALAWAASAWRWGSPLFAGLSAVSLFVLIARVPFGRALCVVAGVTLATVAARRLDDGALAPSHRRAAAVLMLAGVAAVYAALNVYSLEHSVLEDLLRFSAQRVTQPTVVFAIAAVATAVLPLVILMSGFRSRRTLLIHAGIVLLALSLVTLRHYVHVAPLWVVLTLSGTVLIALALAVERALRRAPGGEVWGFTADALFSDERQRQLLQVVPVVGTFTPGAAAPVPADKGFAPGGGGFGGGGASDRF